MQTAKTHTKLRLPSLSLVVPHLRQEHRDIDVGGQPDSVPSLLELLRGAGEDGEAGDDAMGKDQVDTAGCTGDEHVAVLDWDPDGVGSHDDVEEGEKGDGEEND